MPYVLLDANCSRVVSVLAENKQELVVYDRPLYIASCGCSGEP